MGVGNYPIDHSKDLHYTPEELMKEDSAFFSGRLKLMPEPGRWREFLNKSNDLYNNDQMGVETFSRIKCPVLVMAGEKDSYNHLDNVLICARAIPDHQLSIIPGCDHVAFCIGNFCGMGGDEALCQSDDRLPILR